MKRIFLNPKEPLEFKFEQNRDDFIVDEIPLHDFTNQGNFLILHVKKVNLPTWEMIEKLGDFLNLNTQKIGYAGLKDKYATTTQYLSIPLKYEHALKKFHDSRITILDRFKSSKKISIGDLKANRFKIRLHEVDRITAGKIEKRSRQIEKKGMPNYFGYQRFSRDSIHQAQQMIDGEIFIKDPKLKKFLTSVYQSQFFNAWLKKRVEMSQESGEFVLLDGDVMIASDGKLFTPKTPSQKDFLNKKALPTGLLVGRNVFRARDEARKIEAMFDDELLHDKGLRRAAWIYPEAFTCKYFPDQSLMQLEFTLPKAAYATVFIENIAHQNFSSER